MSKRVKCIKDLYNESSDFLLVGVGSEAEVTVESNNTIVLSVEDTIKKYIIFNIRLPRKIFNEHFESIEDTYWKGNKINDVASASEMVSEECTVTKEEAKSSNDTITEEMYKECSNTYNGWEIVKMFENGELLIGTEVIGHAKDCDFKHFFIVDNETVIRDQLTEEEISISFLVGCEFEIIKPNKFVSFTEALQQGLNIKHKDWDTECTTPQNILNHYTKMSNEDISKDLFGNEKVWEVQE